MNKPLLKWSRKHDCCTVCGTTAGKHQANGLCTLCYSKRIYSAKQGAKQPRRWSTVADACIQCGKSDSRHYRQGKCRRCCLRELKREQSAIRNEAAKIAIAKAEKFAALEFRFKPGDLIRKRGLDSCWSPLFQVIRCFRDYDQDRCIGVDIRDGETVMEFRIAECERYGHFRVSV